MSINLLSTSPSGTSRFTSRFIRNSASSASKYFCTCEYDRIVYMVNRNPSSPDTYTFQSYNIQTGETTLIGSLTSSQMSASNNLGDMLCDGVYMYLSFTSSKYIISIKLNDLTNIKKYTGTTTFTCWAKMVWYSDGVIALRDRRGISLFDTRSNTFSNIVYFTSDSTRDSFAIGEKLIVSTDTDLIYYNRETETVTTVSLPISSYESWVSYGEGKFYVVNKAYMFVFDEETATWDETYKPIPFGYNPIESVYAEGLVYVLTRNSNKLWVYDIASNMYAYMFLPWTINDSSDYMVRPVSFHRYLFFQYNTFAFINFEGVYKYNVGYKIGQYSISFAEELCDYSEKDDYLELTPSYMTFVDGSKTENLIVDTEHPTRKTYTLKKSDYKKIKSLKIY